MYAAHDHDVWAAGGALGDRSWDIGIYVHMRASRGLREIFCWRSVCIRGHAL